MPRTSNSEVQALLGKDAEVEQFILSAGVLIDEEVVAFAKKDGIEVSDERLKVLEMWVSAHFYAMAYDGQVQEEKYGDATTTYAGYYGINFKATRYGQTALTLDPTGNLATLGYPKGEVESLCTTS